MTNRHPETPPSSAHEDLRILPDPAAPALEELSALELGQRIVAHADREALHELLSRTLFQWEGTRRVHLPDFLRHLFTLLQGTRPQEILDEAHRLTLNKFANLPGAAPGREARDAPRTDCKYYYAAWLKACEKSLDKAPDGLTREAKAEWLLQCFVLRHFDLSLEEARRSCNPVTHRYEWRVNGRVLRLVMPRWMNGNAKRAWLEQHAGPLREDAEMERKRIQDLVDRELNGRQPGTPPHLDATPTPMDVLLHEEHEFRMRHMAQTLAREKADRIAALPPSVRALGKARLEHMVLDIFQALGEGSFNAKAIARRYRMSAPSFSRFAGSKWVKKRKDDGRPKVPVLWANLAGLLAREPEFVAAAKQAGVWQNVHYASTQGQNEANTPGGSQP